MNTNSFKKSKLAVSVAMIVSAMASASALAEDTNPASIAEKAVLATEENTVATDTAASLEEEVVVTGIRGSLMRSMDIKRESSGIVDAISAEEMGKFPDTNLAESLQRIPGVSISRSNGEGSEITVRGFGPNFNLVMLNGRQMPGTGFERSFKFENLSSDGVSSLELYKSARADVPTGGLGATVNIVTTKPLENPGLKFSIMGKGNMDTSNKKGKDITPEFSGIYSNTFLDDTLGFSATISHYRRDFQQQEAKVQGWQANVDVGSTTNVVDARQYDDEGLPLRSYQIPNANGDFPYMYRDEAGDLYRDGDGNLILGVTDADGVVRNEEGDEVFDSNGDAILSSRGELAQQDANFFPKSMGYSFADVQRRRTNGQATLQYKPIDNLVVTMDYTSSFSQTATERYGWGIWNDFGGNLQAYELDENGTAIWADIAGNDGSFTSDQDTTEVKAVSLGLNIDWQVNESLNLRLDYHDSSNKTDDGADNGTGYKGSVILGSKLLASKEYDYRTGDIPGFLVNWDNGTDQLAPNEIDANFGQFFHRPGRSEIQQLQVDGAWLPDFYTPLAEIKFGVAHSDQMLTGIDAWSGLQGDSLQGLEAVLPDSMFTRHDTNDFLDQFSGGGSDLSPNYYYTFDYGEAIQRLAAYQDNYTADPYAGTPVNKKVNEVLTSAYVQSEWDTEVVGKVVQVNAGLRYEMATVKNPGESRLPQSVLWATESEWITEYQTDDKVILNFQADNNILLPMLDVKVDLTDDLVARASWGKSISRPKLGDLLGGLTVTGSPKIGSRTGFSGNPDLKPFKSTNLDVSFEYYYDDASYVSLGLFKKSVEDWIESGVRQVTFDGVYDVYQGTRWNAAEAAVADSHLQDEIAANPGTPVEELDVPTVTTNEIWDQMQSDGYANADGVFEADPASDDLMVWTLSAPVNATDIRKVHGLEFAIQHMFWDTGFGSSLNVTLVDGNLDYDPYILTQQKALDGLSDSANFQAFYEKNGLSVKFVYAWRDSYLIGQGQDQGTSDTPPQFSKEFGQWDVSVNYEVNDNLTVFFDGVNINNETEQGYGRFEEQFLFARQYGPRYSLGARYSF